MQGEMVSAVASPSSAPPSAGRPHPTYKEMIVQALTELREPSGPSLHAIASYISDHFSGLHSSHEALLSAHLRRLRSQGQVRIVSGRYSLSTDAPPPQKLRGPGRPPKPKAAPPLPGQKRRGRPRKNPDLSAPSVLIPIFQGHKRGRGRPRKDAQVAVASAASSLQVAIAPPPPSGVKRGRGRPRKNALALVASSSSPLLGAIAPPPPSGVKRGRGRPRKNALLVVPSSSPQPGVIAPPPPSGVKRGRGRPRKNALLVVPSSSLLPGVIAPPPPSGVKRGRGRPPKNSYPVASPLLGGKQGPGRWSQMNTTLVSLLSPAMPRAGKRELGWPPKFAVATGVVRDSSVNISVSSNGEFGVKRGRGRPPKVVVGGKRKRGRPPKENMQPESVQSVDAPLTKRGPGRPRKVTESGHEALPTQATDQAGAVQNEVEARNFQSSGTSLIQKRGRGRPRKRPLETEPAETGVTAFVEKRGRGRPRKENTSAGKSAETSASMGIKRGRGRPRKTKPSTDLTEGTGRSEKDGDLTSGKKVETQGVLLVEGMDDEPADTGCVLVSGEEAAIAHLDAGGAMPGVDPLDSNVAPSVISAAITEQQQE